MVNLAGIKDCDLYIKDELIKARIEIVEGEKSSGEVQSIYTGKLGEFIFYRAWSYWIVKGQVPLNVANEMYNDPLGKGHVRVAGNCLCPPPINWVEAPLFIQKTFREKCGLPEGLPEDFFDKLEEYSNKYKQYQELIDDEKQNRIDNSWFIDMYHIDSLAGLRLFADTIKKYKLI